MRFIATIKWLDNGNIQDDMILKIGDIEEDDDDIFFYLDSERELEEFKKEGVHDWVILDVVKDKAVDETKTKMALNKNVAKGIKTRQENELLENNKLIAEFLRANKQPDRIDADVYEYEMYGIIECIEDGEDEKHFYHPEEMLFHTWSWLMPLVESCFERLDSNDHSADEIKRQLLVCNRRGIYKAVVEFIKWYNEQDRFICGVCGDHVNEYTYNEDKDVDECNKCK